MHVEIVSHVWAGPRDQYAKALCYQLSSLILHPPTIDVTMTVFYTPEDSATVAVLAFFEQLRSERRLSYFADVERKPEQKTVFLPRVIYDKAKLRTAERQDDSPVTWNFRPLPKNSLLQRAIGRNMAAKQTKADVIWMADADYLWCEGCLDSLTQLAGKLGPLWFPRETLLQVSHALGDATLDAVTEPGIYAINEDCGDDEPAEFEPKIEKRAIGGIQIVAGDVARKVGYCDGTKWMTPVPEGTDYVAGFKSDVDFRWALGTDGEPIDVPNLFRLRHGVDGQGRVVPGAIPPAE